MQNCVKDSSFFTPNIVFWDGLLLITTTVLLPGQPKRASASGNRKTFSTRSIVSKYAQMNFLDAIR